MDDAELLELGRISIASPCEEDWSKMTGDDRARSCARCQSTVYDLSELTALEARELILSTQGEVCVRFFTRADGTVLTRDCPVGVTTKRRRGVLASAALAVGALGAVAAFAPSVMGAPDDAPPVRDLSSPAPLEPLPTTAAAPAPAPDERWMEQRRGRFHHEPSPSSHVMGRMQVVRIITEPSK